MQYINYETETISPAATFLNSGKEILIVNPDDLVRLTEIICTDENCRFPKLTLRILNHIFLEIDKENRWAVCPRYVAEKLGVNYDTVTKCLKYLRSVGALLFEKADTTIH